LPYRCEVDFDAYAQTAADLVNTDLSDMEALQDMFAEREYMRSRVTERDLATFRRARKKLRDVFERGSAGEDEAAVEILNALLEAYPVQPRISGHPDNDWHMHVSGRGATVASEYLAGAAWGLSVWLCNYGSARFGICADERCSKVFLDTSSNCCRRFCSERCATRSHVAAHRARKKEVAVAAS
jgi:predicted RNA-binding Zn ribbon-like protein